MGLKQYVRYQMDFGGKWVRSSAFLMGVSFFLRIVYYFGLINLQDCGAGEWIGCLILPLLLCGVYLVLLSALKWNAPGIYGILGTALCLVLIIWNFSTGDFLRIFLSVIIYAAAGVTLLATAGGYLPGRLLSCTLFAVPFLCRVLFYRSAVTGIQDWFLEASVLCLIASLFCLPLSFKPTKPKTSADTNS